MNVFTVRREVYVKWLQFRIAMEPVEATPPSAVYLEFLQNRNSPEPHPPVENPPHTPTAKYAALQRAPSRTALR